MQMGKTLRVCKQLSWTRAWTLSGESGASLGTHSRGQKDAHARTHARTHAHKHTHTETRQWDRDELAKGMQEQVSISGDRRWMAIAAFALTRACLLKQQAASAGSLRCQVKAELGLRLTDATNVGLLRTLASATQCCQSRCCVKLCTGVNIA